MAKCTECVHYGVCKVLVGEQQIRIADKACSFAENCVAYKNKESFAEVVRCKDCVYNENGTCTHSEYFDDTKYRPDYFCADGERKEG